MRLVLDTNVVVDLIVSGDADLLTLKAFRDTPIVTAAEAVDRIAQSSRG